MRELNPKLAVLIEEGKVISFNDEQSEKTNFSISYTDKGIAICLRDEHPLKAASLKSQFYSMMSKVQQFDL